MKIPFLNNRKYKSITHQEAKLKLDKEKDIVLLDVRTKEEYMQNHIPRSILMPLGVLDQEVQNKIPHKDTTIFVYCRSGSRSASAAKILAKLGYTKVYNLGGINEWPYETKRSK